MNFISELSTNYRGKHTIGIDLLSIDAATDASTYEIELFLQTDDKNRKKTKIYVTNASFK